jgi:carboxyl-terminal processing protease
MSIPRILWRSASQSAIAIIIFAAGFSVGNQAGTTSAQGSFVQPEGTEAVFETFWQVWDIIQDEFVDPAGNELLTETLVDGAITGMVEALGDENSGYMTAQQYPVMFDDLSGTVEGIGVVIQTNEEIGGIEIVNVLEGTPAAKVGIQIGDVFAAVNGEEVLGYSQLELASLVRGPSGTTVNITMLRDGERVE